MHLRGNEESSIPDTNKSQTVAQDDLRFTIQHALNVARTLEQRLGLILQQVSSHWGRLERIKKINRSQMAQTLDLQRKESIISIMNSQIEGKNRKFFNQVNPEALKRSLRPNLDENLSQHNPKSNKPSLSIQMNSPRLRPNGAPEEVFITDKKWNIVTSLVTGIHKSISLVSQEKMRLPTRMDFDLKNTIELEAVLEQKFQKCRFVDYAPNIFEVLRSNFGISNESYIESIGYHTFQKAFLNKLALMLMENSSGKSGSFFFHTADMKYMIKTIKKNEFRALKRMLPEYFKYMMDHPETLITKYFGMHHLKCYSKKGSLVYSIYIGEARSLTPVVMNNFFASLDQGSIREIYDLKGSLYKRYVPKARQRSPGALKDQNFLENRIKFLLNEHQSKKLLDQLQKDVEFLGIQRVMDYSLLVGITSQRAEPSLSSLTSSKNNIFSKNSNQYSEYYSSDFDAKQSRAEPNANQAMRQPQFFRSMDKKNVYFFGIIDTLTLYNWKKRAEYFFKRVFVNRDISCIPPSDYQFRFYNFIRNAISVDEAGRVLSSKINAESASQL